MAGERLYADEIPIPITITLPWSGRMTREGKPWPRDARGRDWPEHRGRPEFQSTNSRTASPQAPAPSTDPATAAA